MKSFSLVEVMTVIAITAVLVAVGVPAYKKMVFNAKIAELSQKLFVISDKAEVFFNTNGYWTNGGNFGYSEHIGEGVIDPAFFAVNVQSFLYQAAGCPSGGVVRSTVAGYILADVLPEAEAGRAIRIMITKGDFADGQVKKEYTVIYQTPTTEVLTKVATYDTELYSNIYEAQCGSYN